MIYSIVLFIHVAVCLILVVLILLQQGKGASLSASFGGGGDSVFGAAGADNILTKITTVLAVTFFCTSITLIKLQSPSGETSGGILDYVPETAKEGAPIKEVEKAAPTESPNSAAPVSTATVPAAESATPSAPQTVSQEGVPADVAGTPPASETAAPEVASQTETAKPAEQPLPPVAPEAAQ